MTSDLGNRFGLFSFVPALQFSIVDSLTLFTSLQLSDLNVLGCVALTCPEAFMQFDQIKCRNHERMNGEDCGPVN